MSDYCILDPKCDLFRVDTKLFHSGECTNRYTVLLIPPWRVVKNEVIANA
jgi:hypothetical protein